MASKEAFQKALLPFDYQGAHAEDVARAARSWSALTDDQKNSVQNHDRRARVYAAGYAGGYLHAQAELRDLLQQIAEYMDLYAVEQVRFSQHGSLERIAEDVLAVLGVRNGEQP